MGAVARQGGPVSFYLLLRAYNSLHHREGRGEGLSEKTYQSVIFGDVFVFAPYPRRTL